MELKITTLIENMPDEAGVLKYEHGLSLYIEFQGKKLLFDTGQTGEFVSNAQRLEKPLQDVDAVIISHGHYDHSGGVEQLSQILKKSTPLYVGEEFFAKKYKLTEEGTYRYNGNPFTKAELDTWKLCPHPVTQDTTKLWENMVLFKNFQRVTEFEALNPKFFVETKQGMVPDAFPDEVALGLRTTRGWVLVVGCSHIGIGNILKSVSARTKEPIYAVLGGTHLIEADEERLKATMQIFRECGVSCVAVSHCTGEQGIVCAKEAFGDRFVRNNTGNVFTM